MNKNMKKISLFLLSGLFILLAGCQREIIPPVDDSVTLTLQGNVQDPDTKTSFGTPDGNTIPFLWKIGDELGLYVQSEGTSLTGAQNIIANIVKEDTNGPGFNSGAFTTTLPALTAGTLYSVHIYYPYYKSAGDGTTISHSIPAVQTQATVDNSEHFGASGGFAYATSSFTTPEDITDYAPDLTFTLSHKTSYIWFRINATAEGFAGWKIKQITFQTPSGYYITGNAIFNPVSNSFTLEESNRSNQISLNIPDGMTLSADNYVNAYMVSFPTSISGEDITIKYLLEKSDASETKIISHIKTINDESLALGEGSTHRFSETIPATAGNGWTIESSAIDLSAGGTANCYIVSTPGNYTFDATTIGNGSKGIMLPVATTFFHTETASISPSSVQLIWQTAPNLITDVALSGGKITFTKGSATEGNALIAVYDNADPAAAGAKILWSWHIWCTDIGAGQTYVNAAGKSFLVMDRNLGATTGLTAISTDESILSQTIGLFYQWGRKDPFIGAASISTKGTTKATLYDASGQAVTHSTVVTSTTVGTIENSIQNPSTFICCDGTASSSTYPYDWFNKYGKTSGPSYRGLYFWGNPAGYDYASVTPPSPEKSIYDPCPAGWMVAPYDTFTGLTVNTPQDNKGLLLFFDGVNSTYFPCPGRLGRTNGNIDTYNGILGTVWTSSYRANVNTACGNMNLQTKTSSLSATVTPTNNLSPGSGYSVRCVQEF